MSTQSIISNDPIHPISLLDKAYMDHGLAILKKIRFAFGCRKASVTKELQLIDRVLKSCEKDEDKVVRERLVKIATKSIGDLT